MMQNNTTKLQMLPQIPIESHIESHISLIISKSKQNLCSFKTPKVQISCQ